jgi:hypothetical protein
MPDEPAIYAEASDLEAQLSALEHLDLQGLREVWRNRWDAAPKLRSIGLLRRIIAWRIQAAAYGGLASDTRARLRSKSMPRIPLPKFGTRLTREYKGVLYTVEVGVGSLHYAGKAYGSLSEIAREITGVRWNGPRFFGLRPSRGP